MITRTRANDQLTDLAPLSEKDAALARQSSNAIAGFIDGTENVTLVLTRHDDSQQLEAIVPTFALRLLAHVLQEVANGQPVTLMPRSAELTTHQAADLLGVSRPFFIKQLETGKIPFRKVGTHRRIRYDDLVTYMQRERVARHKALDELARYSEEIGLYDLEDKMEETEQEEQ